MGLFFSFSKQRKPRGFQLQHRYYDERKLRLQKIENKLFLGIDYSSKVKSNFKKIRNKYDFTIVISNLS